MKEFLLPKTYHPSDEAACAIASFAKSDTFIHFNESIHWKTRAFIMIVEANCVSKKIDVWQHCFYPKYQHSLQTSDNLFALLCLSIATKFDDIYLPPFLGRRLQAFNSQLVFERECKLLDELGWRLYYTCPYDIIVAAQHDLKLQDRTLENAKVLILVSSVNELDERCRASSHEFAAAAAVAANDASIVDELVDILNLLVAEVCVRHNTVHVPPPFCLDRAVPILYGIRSETERVQVQQHWLDRDLVETQMRFQKRKYVSPHTNSRYDTTIPICEDFALSTPASRRQKL
jgi:hypothetical protein